MFAASRGTEKSVKLLINKKVANVYKSEFCNVSYNKKLNIVFVEWKKYCHNNDYRDPLRYAIEIMKNHNGCNYCADTRNGFENEKDDTQWVFDVFLPQVAETSCKKIFFIIDNNNTLKDELEGQSSKLSEKFEVHYCFGLNDIKNVLAQKSVYAE